MVGAGQRGCDVGRVKGARQTNGGKLSHLACRVLAILLGLQAIRLLPPLLTELFTPGLLVPLTLMVGVGVETVLLAGLAAVFWFAAGTVGVRLLEPGSASPEDRLVERVTDLEVTAFRAVGLYVVLVAFPAVVNWVVVLATLPTTLVHSAR